MAGPRTRDDLPEWVFEQRAAYARERRNGGYVTPRMRQANSIYGLRYMRVRGRAEARAFTRMAHHFPTEWQQVRPHGGASDAREYARLTQAAFRVLARCHPRVWNRYFTEELEAENYEQVKVRSAHE